MLVDDKNYKDYKDTWMNIQKNNTSYEVAETQILNMGSKMAEGFGQMFQQEKSPDQITENG